VTLAQQRVIEPEELDRASADDSKRALADLARVNRYFGGHRVLRQIIAGLARRDERFSFLDVGAATGDIGAAVRSQYPHATVFSLDRLSFHLDGAAQPKLTADAFQLPFKPASFDFVFSSFFLHHFTDDQIVELLASFRKLARRAVLAIDLERGPLALRFLPATQWLFQWDHMFVRDGLISVRAAFKRHELLALARRAGLAQAVVSTHRPWGRLSLVAPVNGSTTGWRPPRRPARHGLA
jgi:SAM-dependent methyltransferase